jgi:hypothetical protein
MSALADKITAMTEQEKLEGKAIVAACESLKLALATSEAKILEMATMIGDIPQLQAEVALLRLELADANEAADLIATINSAPPTPQTTPEVEPTVESETAPEVVETEPQTFEVVE